MLRLKNYTCSKCGRTFTKMVGGIVMSPKEQGLMLRPVCDKCKLDTFARILHVK